MNSDWDSGNLNRGAGGPGAQPYEGRLRGLLRRAEEAARRGQRAEARRLFRQALILDPECEEALLWLGYLAGTPQQSLEYLRQAQACHPNSPRVREAIAWAEERMREVMGPVPGAEGKPAELSGQLQGQTGHGTIPAARASAPMGWAGRRRRRRQPVPMRRVALAGFGIVGLSILAVVLVFLVQRVGAPGAGPAPEPSATVNPLPSDMATLRELASAAVADQDWERLIPLLERMRELTPEDEGVRQQSAVAHLRLGLQLVNEGRLDEAIAHYDAAIRLYANDTDLQMARRIAIGYRDGRAAIEAGRWAEAIDSLRPVYEVAPDLRDVAELLYSAYLHEAQAFDSAQKLEAARLAYAHAAAIRPGDQQVQARLEEITRILTPPTPTPTPRPHKRIEISISSQRLRAYENEALLFDWVCSTGEPGRPTRPGDYQVLDKLPEAWSSVWGLRMPYWLGIYWAGGSENGIHALPILKDGQILWAGFLGRPVSFGCIILDTPNAQRLYEWADIGTPVKILP